MARDFLFSLALGAIALCAPGGAGAFELRSPDIADGGAIDRKFVYVDCGGENLSPELAWSDPPAGAKSFAVVVHDPDAPKAGGFWHWIVANIPASARGLPQGAGARDGKTLPSGARQFENDFGDRSFDGPCPPPGKPHRYQFTVHALGVETLAAPASGAASAVSSLIAKETIGKASLAARYGR